jgi:hypothetical protein
MKRRIRPTLLFKNFIQEEAGPEYAQLIIDFINGDPQPFIKDRVVPVINL